MSKKLDEIELYGWPTFGLAEVEWLIQRVRKLETALTEVRRTANQARGRGATAGTVRLSLGFIESMIDEALKEN